MLRRFIAVTVAAVAIHAGSAQGQISIRYQSGVTMLPGGSLYDGTVDTEFRAANPTESQAENETFSIDQFDGGFQTQGAIRFENLLVSDGGLIPNGLAREDILFAELRVWSDSGSDPDANIDFNRTVGPDTTSGEFWEEDDTWASLGGDLIPDEFGLLDGDPISRDNIEAAAIPDFRVQMPELDSSDRLGIALDSGLSLLEALESAFVRLDATEAVRDWLVDGTPNFGWSISNDTGNGWDIATSELTEELASEWSEAGLLPENFRPALTIVYVDGPILDLDDDDDVDELDFDAFLDRLAVELNGPIEIGAPGDFDFDRDVDLDDFNFFKGNYAEQHAMFPPAGSASLAGGQVPEPASALLLLLGLLGSAVIRRRMTT